MSRIRSHAFIVTFLGPVGVGKSTQMRLLQNYLKSRNIRVTTTFIKSSHVFAHFLSDFLKISGSYEKVSYSSGLTRLSPRRDIVRKLFPLWSFLDMLSIIIKFFFTVYIPFCLGFMILIEEGLMMTVHAYFVSFPRFFGTKPLILPLLPRLLGWVISKNHVNVVLDAVDEELGQRRGHRSYRKNELSEYVYLQRLWIKRLNCADTFFVETTSESILGVHNKIVNALQKRMF